MNILKNYKILWSAIIILILMSIWLCYNILDLSITIDHGSSQIRLVTEQRDCLVSTVNVLNKDIDENIIMDLFSDTSKFDVFKKGNGHIVVNQVSFFLEENKLFRVSVGE